MPDSHDAFYRARIERNLTQVQFARFLRIAQATVSRLEKREAEPGYKLRIKLQKKLGIDPTRWRRVANPEDRPRRKRLSPPKRKARRKSRR